MATKEGRQRYSEELNVKFFYLNHWVEFFSLGKNDGRKDRLDKEVVFYICYLYPNLSLCIRTYLKDCCIKFGFCE